MKIEHDKMKWYKRFVYKLCAIYDIIFSDEFLVTCKNKNSDIKTTEYYKYGTKST